MVANINTEFYKLYLQCKAVRTEQKVALESPYKLKQGFEK